MARVLAGFTGRCRLRRFFLALVSLIMMLGPPGEAHAAEPGVVTDMTWGISDADQDRTVSAIEGSGAKWVRLSVGWHDYEPSKGFYDWWSQARVDRAVNLCQAAGLKVVVTVMETPRWASGSRNRHVPPRDPTDFADFARYLADRHAGAVQAWEIWNEQNTDRFWGPSPNAEGYAALLRAAYPAIKQADANAKVVFGGVAAATAGARQFVLDAYAAGAKDYFDILGWHPYTYVGAGPDEVRRDEAGRVTADSFTGYRTIRDDMLARSDDKPIWLTEFGWSTSTQIFDPLDHEPWSTGVSETTQATYLTRAFTVIQEDPYVEVAAWYNLRNNYWDYDADNLEARFGLMSTRFAPKPAYGALQAVATGAAVLP